MAKEPAVLQGSRKPETFITSYEEIKPLGVCVDMLAQVRIRTHARHVNIMPRLRRGCLCLG